VEFNASRDLANLKVADGNWIPVQLGDVDSISIGETVLAIGSPGGSEDAILEQTVTRGVVSSMRDIPSEANPNIMVAYIQTDAAINAGNNLRLEAQIRERLGLGYMGLAGLGSFVFDPMAAQPAKARATKSA
jgi:hypothetical protein